MTIRKNLPSLTFERAYELFEFFPDTGEILRKTASRGRRNAGKPAGWVSGTGYRMVSIDGESILVHRLCWFMVHGLWPDGEIDHKNHIRLDNRISNLRDVTHQQNSQNTRAVKSGKKHGATLAGANWDTYSGRWKSSICVQGKHKHLGRFDSEHEAHAAYVDAKRKLHEGSLI